MANWLPKKLNTYQIDTLQKAKKQLWTDETRRRLKEWWVYDETKRRYEATIWKEQQQPKQDIWWSITGWISKGISKLTWSTKWQAEMFEDQTKQQPTQTKTTNQITKQQEISPKYTEEKQITQKPTPTQSKTYTWTTIDTDKSWFLTWNELKWAEKEAYDMLNEQERQMFEEIWQDAARAGRDYVKEQLKFVRDVTGRKEYMTEQEKLNKKQKWISDEIQSIYDDSAIRESKEQLEDLKQNIWYLWTRWKPWVSNTKINAVSEQLSKAQTMVEEVQELISLREEARDLQEESRVLAFNDQISNLNTQLTDKINQAVLDSVNQLNSMDLQWKIESEEDLEKIRTELLQNLDTEISWITDWNIRQRQFLLDRFDKYTQEKKQERYRQEAINMEYQQNSQIINEKMSNAKWYYVDWNWSPITWKDWMPIQIPKEAPMKPIYDKEEGKLITFRTDEATWWIVADVQQVIDEPTFTQETTNNYASLISKWKLDIEDVPENLRSSVINSMANIPEAEMPKTISKSFDLWESFKVFYDDWSSEIIPKDKPNSQVQSVRDAWDRLVMVYDDWTTQDIKKWKEQISELQKTQIDKLKAEIKRIEKWDELTDLDKAKAEQIRMQTKAIEQEISWITPTTSTLTDMTSTLQRPAGSTNVWQDTNNPWNIMADNDKQKEYARSLGATWFYKSPNGRTYAVFPDMETWLNATTADIKSKLEWWSYWVNENTTLWELATWWTSWPNAAPNEWAISNYEKLTWVNRNTKISDIPQQDLISAIIANEWVDITRSSTIPQAQEDLKQEQLKKSYLNRIKAGALTPSEYNDIQQEAIKWWWIKEYDKALENSRKTELTTEWYKTERDLRKEFSWLAEVKNFKEAFTQYKTVLSTIWTETWPWDMAAIFSFMKTLDPSSVVRETEFAEAAKSLWFWEWLKNMVDVKEWKIKGRKITTEWASQFWEVVEKMIQDKAILYNRKYDEFTKNAERQWLNPEFIVWTRVSDLLKNKWETYNIAEDSIRASIEIWTWKKIFPWAVNINSSDQDINNFLSQ